MSISYDLTSNDPRIKAISEVRLGIGDTKEGKGARPDGSNYSDDEVFHYYTEEEDHVGKASAKGLEILATEWLRAPRTMFGSLVDPRHIGRGLQRQAKELRSQHGYSTSQSGGFSIRVHGNVPRIVRVF